MRHELNFNDAPMTQNGLRHDGFRLTHRHDAKRRVMAYLVTAQSWRNGASSAPNLRGPEGGRAAYRVRCAQCFPPHLLYTPDREQGILYPIVRQIFQHVQQVMRSCREHVALTGVQKYAESQCAIA